MHEATPRPLLLLLVIIITPLVLLLLLRRSSSNDGDKVQPHASSKTTSTKENPILPPSPPGLPVIGHLHLIGANPYVSLRDLAARYGNGGLALLRLGTVPNLVVSSPRAARAVLRTHDHTFASRPTSTLSDALLYGSSDVAFSPYGEHWRQLKKIVTAHLFTTKKVRSFRDARQQEVRLVMAKIRRHESEGTAVDVSETVDAFTNDVVCRAVSGKSFRAEGQDRLFRELIEMNNSMFGGFSLLEDYYPWVARSSLTWLVRGRAREGHKRWDDLLEKIITDHESRRSSACDKQDGAISERPQDESDFIDVLLSVQQEYGISRDHIKAILMDMFAAGTDTSSSVLQFAMAELMRNPDLMAKLQTELRNNTPEGQEMVAEENLATMSYLRAVVKETLRLHPPAPLLLPHLSMADCEVLDGYTVPAGTRVVVNAWAIGRDPESWGTKPEEFMPERFVVMDDDGGIDFKGNDFRFLPFGAGRRICPGLNFGLATVEIMLANLVYCFDWELPDGMEKEDIDMTEVFGLTIHPKEKLHLVPKPRGSAARFL